MLTAPSVTEIRRPTTQEEELQKDEHAIRAVREQANMRTLADFFVFFQLLITYRKPMIVEEAIVFGKAFEDDIYYRCPRCQNALDREFLAYCDSCGQCLDWRDYQKAQRTYITPKR